VFLGDFSKEKMEKVFFYEDGSKRGHRRVFLKRISPTDFSSKRQGMISESQNQIREVSSRILFW